MRANTDWFKDAGWGIFMHFLAPRDGAYTPDNWNKDVYGFDVEGLAKQLQEINAGYFIITIGQGSPYYCAPNETYDKLTKFNPSRCSQRDLVSDLYNALSKYDIPLLVYAPADGPWASQQAREGLGIKYHWSDANHDNNDWSRYRLPEFMRNWEEILREWSLRWGKKVRGWWIDGAYHKEVRYPEHEEPNLASFARALKAGNPEAIVAFNPGVKVPVVAYSEYEDYTAGEISNALPLDDLYSPPIQRFLDGEQYHVLSFLGKGWGQGPVRFPDELAIGYTEYIISKEGVISWDVPHTETGLIEDEFMRQLRKLKIYVNTSN